MSQHARNLRRYRIFGNAGHPEAMYCLFDTDDVKQALWVFAKHQLIKPQADRLMDGDSNTYFDHEFMESPDAETFRSFSKIVSAYLKWSL